jgi:hypothetical protein
MMITACRAPISPARPKASVTIWSAPRALHKPGSKAHGMISSQLSKIERKRATGRYLANSRRILFVLDQIASTLAA